VYAGAKVLMSFNKHIATAGIPIAAGLYSGFTNKSQDVTFTGAFLRGSLLTAGGLALVKAGDPKYAKMLSEMTGKRGMAARAAYMPAYLAHETGAWVKQHAINPAVSMTKKIGHSQFRDIKPMEIAGASFTAYSAYEAGDILTEAGEGSVGGVAMGVAMFAAGKYGYMAGIYGAKAIKHKDVIKETFHTYRKAPADEKEFMRRTAGKLIKASSQEGALVGVDWVKKGTMRSRGDMVRDMSKTGMDIFMDPTFHKIRKNMSPESSRKIGKAIEKMFKSNYRGNM